MSSNDVSTFLSEDVIYHILLWLPVISLLRFKCVCKSWRVLIESTEFIKHHLRHHHYDCPSLKNENRNLIICLPAKDPPITFLMTSIHNFEAPTKFVRLDFPNLQEYNLIGWIGKGVIIFNGIVCLRIPKEHSQNHDICLWNPVTKQHRFLPQSPSSLRPRAEFISTVVGFGFDVETDSYKVVKLIRNCYSKEKTVEVYNLSTDSWRSIDSLFPVDYIVSNHPKMPFQNGSCFCWGGRNSEHQHLIFCFDFGSETFRSISFPNVHCALKNHLRIVNDKIACFLSLIHRPAEFWVLNDYGSRNESWAKLYTIDHCYSNLAITAPFVWSSVDGNFIFYRSWGVCRYNVVTQETKHFTESEFLEGLKGSHLRRMKHYFTDNVTEFKESLMSVGGGNEAPSSVKNS